MDNGWIKIHRRILDWEWYDDPVVFSVFLHLLLTANHSDKKWHGILIKRGQTLTSVAHLVEEINRPRKVGRRVKKRIITIQSTRTALKRLVSTNELTIEATRQYSLITIRNYDEYQDTNRLINKQLTNNQQTANKQLTTNKNVKNVKNVKKGEGTHSITKNTFQTLKDLTPHILEEISIKYGVPLRFVEDVRENLELYVGSTGRRYKDYRLTLINWVKKDRNKFLLEQKSLSKRRGGVEDARGL